MQVFYDILVIIHYFDNKYFLSVTRTQKVINTPAMRLQTADSSFLSLLLLSCAVCLSLLSLNSEAANLKQVVTISDQKEWKKLLRTRTNVLALFMSGEKHVASLLPTFDSVADRIRGKGTLVYVDCTTKDGKKFCKNLKVKANPYVLKHYKDGKFNKDYDRLLNEKSMYSFMENPTADPPWSEDSTASNVRHIEGPSDFERLLAKEKRPILVFFYAPWCGHCKRMKPEFAEAATEVKGRFVLAGMDVDSPDAYGIRQEFNITGFPTIVYFEKGKKKFDYGGGRDKDGILEWLKDPKPPAEAPPTQEEQPWSEVESDVVHLTSDTFDPFVTENPSVLVMFYAPWCGHCKAMKPDYMQAAKMMKDAGVHGVLAAVDATKETELGKKYDVKGFPTIKYFGEGEMKYEYGYGRSATDIVDFMTEPRAPPPPEKDWAEIESEVRRRRKGCMDVFQCSPQAKIQGMMYRRAWFGWSLWPHQSL